MGASPPSPMHVVISSTLELHAFNPMFQDLGPSAHSNAAHFRDYTEEVLSHTTHYRAIQALL